MKNELDAKVRAVNAANKYATELYLALAEIFRPLVGSQVTKASGGLLQKVEKLLPEFPNTVRLSVYKTTRNYSLSFTVKTCEMINGTTCTYHEAVVYVGGLRGNVLVDLYAPFQGRSDYTVEDVEKARDEYRAAKKEADRLHSALFPFGE